VNRIKEGRSNLTLEIRIADIDDAVSIHEVTLDAFEEYRDTFAPSSALQETVDSILAPMKEGRQKAAICLIDGTVVGAVRFCIDEGLYFSRLSVRRQYQGNGIAKAMLSWLEDYARTCGHNRLWCRVRKAVSRNVRLYQSLGYTVCKEETVVRTPDVQFQVLTMEKLIQTAPET
jgi:GNAT superfamily N-acetyltransferase